MTNGQPCPEPPDAPRAAAIAVGDEMRGVWARHELLRAGEQVVAFVTMICAVGYDADGYEYRRNVKLVPPDTTRGETRDLLEAGLRMLATTTVGRSRPEGPRP